MLIILNTIFYKGTKGDGYTITINGSTYDEDNPKRVDTLNTIHGCDSIIVTNLTFNPTSVEDLHNKNDIMYLYPNPTKIMSF